jgi:hypothetical protein
MAENGTFWAIQRADKVVAILYEPPPSPGRRNMFPDSSKQDIPAQIVPLYF